MENISATATFTTCAAQRCADGLWSHFCQTFSKLHMRRIVLCVVAIGSILFSKAQSLQLGVLGGLSNYQGDLTTSAFKSQMTKAAVGITATYPLSEHWSVRGGFTYTKLTGDDKYNRKDYLRARNLSFSTSLSELSVVGEYATFSL